MIRTPGAGGAARPSDDACTPRRSPSARSRNCSGGIHLRLELVFKDPIVVDFSGTRFFGNEIHACHVIPRRRNRLDQGQGLA